MDQKIIFYFRRFVYMMSGFLTHIALLLLNTWGMYSLFRKNSDSTGFIILIIILFFVILFVHVILTLATTLDLDDDKGYVLFLRSPVRMFMKRKLVYDSRLGYFIGYINNDVFQLFDQGFFGMKQVYKANINKDVDQLAISIKERLNEVYNKKIQELAKKKNITDAQTKIIKDWDGFLDDQTRRDQKIKKILK